MTAGRRDTLITFEGGAPTIDDYGGETLGWTTLGQEWAAVFYGKGDERRQAAVEQGQQAATFQVLANPVTRAVVIKNRIVAGADTWDITGIAPDTPNRGEIEFTGVRSL